MRFLLTLGTVAFLATPALAAAPKQTSPAQVTVNLTPVRGSNPVVNGTSTTTLTSTNLTKLTNGNYTLSIHKSTHDPKNPVACGDIKLANPVGTTR